MNAVQLLNGCEDRERRGATNLEIILMANVCVVEWSDSSSGHITAGTNWL